MNLIITLIIAYLGSDIEAYADAKKWIKNETIKHTLSLIWRVIIGVVVTSVCVILNPYTINTFINGVHVVLLLAVAALHYWLLFDLKINAYKGMKWNYKGETAFFDDNTPEKVVYFKVVSYVMFFVFNVLFYVGF